MQYFTVVRYLNCWSAICRQSSTISFAIQPLSYWFLSTWHLVKQTLSLSTKPPRALYKQFFFMIRIRWIMFPRDVSMGSFSELVVCVVERCVFVDIIIYLTSNPFGVWNGWRCLWLVYVGSPVPCSPNLLEL